MILDMKSLLHPRIILLYESNSQYYTGATIHFCTFKGIDGEEYFFRHEGNIIQLLKSIEVIASFLVPDKPRDGRIPFYELERAVHHHCGVYLKELEVTLNE